MQGPQTMVERLVDATNRHDLDALVACFAEDYVNETPAHPERGFRGRAQVRRNWEQIFALVPDVRVEVVRRAVDGDTVWTEWEMIGTRRDGRSHRMCGVMVFGVREGLARWVRFYLEPVEERGVSADEAVREQLGRR